VSIIPKKKKNGNGYSQSKYKNRKTIIDGIVFASRSEAQYYVDLKQQKLEGKIADFELQPAFELQPPCTYHGKKIRAIKYVADFKIIDWDNHEIIVDIKGSRGFLTEVFKLKMKMLLFKYPDIDFRIVTVR